MAGGMRKEAAVASHVGVGKRQNGTRSSVLEIPATAIVERRQYALSPSKTRTAVEKSFTRRAARRASSMTARNVQRASVSPTLELSSLLNVRVRSEPGGGEHDAREGNLHRRNDATSGSGWEVDLNRRRSVTRLPAAGAYEHRPLNGRSGPPHWDQHGRRAAYSGRRRPIGVPTRLARSTG